MTPADSMIVILALCSVIGTMSGVILWLFKEQIRSSNERVEDLEQREERTLDTLSQNVRQMFVVIEAMAQMVKELRLLAQIGHPKAADPP